MFDCFLRTIICISLSNYDWIKAFQCENYFKMFSHTGIPEIARTHVNVGSKFFLINFTLKWIAWKIPLNHF